MQKKLFLTISTISVLLILGVGGAFLFLMEKDTSHSYLKLFSAQKDEAEKTRTNSDANKESFSSVETSPEVTQTEKLKVLDQILESRNDNDPRLDRELKNLTEQDRMAFREKYSKLPLENRNERGTVVFLLGRHLESEQDFLFLKEVLSEKPCLSLNDCNTTLKQNEVPETGETEVTLAYPQLVALKSVEQFIDQKKMTPESEAFIQKTIDAAKQSQIPKIVEKGSELERKWNERNKT